MSTSHRLACVRVLTWVYWSLQPLSALSSGGVRFVLVAGETVAVVVENRPRRKGKREVQVRWHRPPRDAGAAAYQHLSEPLTSGKGVP